MGKGDQFWPVLQQFFVNIQAQQAIIGDRNKLQASICALGKHLPGNKIAMVLHLSEHNQIACMDVRIAPAIGDEVNTLGGIACEDDLFALASIDEASDLHTGFFHPCRCLFAELVDPTMNIGVRRLIVGAHSSDNSTRLLRTCRAIKINQWFTVYLSREDRE